MTDCEYCHKEIKKDEDFVLAGKYPSNWEKWKRQRFHTDLLQSPEDYGTIYHKSCFLEMAKNEDVQK